MTDATEGKTLAELDVKPGDVVRCVDTGGHGKLVSGRQYDVVNQKGDPAIHVGGGWHIISHYSARFTIVSRAPAPAPDAALAAVAGTGAAGEAVVKTLAALKDERLFQASLAALTGIMANPERWKDIKNRYDAGTMNYDEASASNARKAVSVADALLAALEARHD